MRRGPARSAVRAALVAALAIFAACGDGDGSGGGALQGTPTTSTSTSTTTTIKDPEKDAGRTIEIDSARRLDDETRAEAEDLRRRSVAAAEAHGWADPESARAAGFVPMFGEEQHLVNVANVTDGVSWDPDRPEFLVVDADGALLGLMFSAPSTDHDQPPPPGAPLVRWHYHRWPQPVCLQQGIITHPYDAAGACPPGTTPSHESALMAHVWTIDVDDPFSSDMAAHQHR